jgi:hypothetical protein
VNEKQLKLARELAAHPRFEWRHGMLPEYERAHFVWSAKLDRVDEDGWNPQYCDSIALPNGWPDAKREAWPDITDDATGGVLWALAGKPAVVPCECGDVIVEEHAGTTLAEACTRLLLAQWAREVTP